MKDRWGLIFHASLNGLSIEVDDYRLQTAPKFHSNEDWRCCCQMKSGALNRSCIIYTCEYYVWRKRQQMKNLYFTYDLENLFNIWIFINFSIVISKLCLIYIVNYLPLRRRHALASKSWRKKKSSKEFTTKIKKKKMKRKSVTEISKKTIYYSVRCEWTRSIASINLNVLILL